MSRAEASYTFEWPRDNSSKVEQSIRKRYGPSISIPDFEKFHQRSHTAAISPKKQSQYMRAMRQGVLRV